MKRFIRPAGSLVSTALFTSVAIDGLSFVHQASANPNPEASKQTSEAEKPDTLANAAASNPVESVAPPEAMLTQQFAPVPTELAISPIAPSDEAGSKTDGEGQARPNQSAQTSQNKVAKLADLIAGVQRRITAEEAADLLGDTANPAVSESLLAEPTAAQNGDNPASSEDSLTAANGASKEEGSETMHESPPPRLVEQLTAISDQKQGAKKAEQQQGLIAEALNLAESGQIDQARRIVQNAKLIANVKTATLARIDELAEQPLEQPQPAVAEGSQAASTSDQRSPELAASLAVFPNSAPLQRLCPPFALNPNSIEPSKATAVNPLPTIEAQQPANSSKQIATPSEDMQPEFSAALPQHYPFPPNQTAQINGVDQGDLPLHSLSAIGKRLNTALTSSRLMHSHSVLTRFQIANLDKSTHKAEESQPKASPTKSEMAKLAAAETVAPQQTTDCMSVNVSYRNALPPSSQVNLAFPLTIPAAITSLFGWRIHPISGDRRFHAGTDFGAPMGTPVLAALSGRVMTADYMGGYGNTVILEHPDTSQRTLYGHLSTVMVQSGMWVEQGTVIGQVGSTGLSTGPHLHFEVRQLMDDGWAPINPIHSPGATVAHLGNGGN